MSANVATIYVVDDDPAVRKSLGRLLKAAGFRVEAFASAAAFLAQAPHARLGCIVLDVQMPDLTGIELQQALAGAGIALPIIFITGHGDVPTSVRAMKAGAVDFLAKPFDDKELFAAIALALDRAQRESESRADADVVEQRLATLTPRERQVLLQVLTGKLNKQIAGELGASEKTIKVHRARVMNKMQVRSVADLVRLCEKAGVRVP